MAMINAVLYKRRSFCGSGENPVSADRETGKIVRQTEHERNCIDDKTPEILKCVNDRENGGGQNHKSSLVK
jgi:hypothetical protein